MRSSAEAAHQRPRLRPVELQVSTDVDFGVPAFLVLDPGRDAHAGGEGAGGGRVRNAFRIVPEHDHRRRRRSEEPTSEIQSLMRNSYAVFCSKQKNTNKTCTILQQYASINQETN